MRSSRRATWQTTLAAADAVVLAGLWWVAPWLRAAVLAVWPFDLVPGDVPVFRAVDPELTRAAAVVVVGGWLMTLGARGRYARPEATPSLRMVATSSAWAVGAVFALLYVVKLPHLSRSLLAGFAALTVPALWASSGLVRALARLPVGEPMRLAVIGPEGALQHYEGHLARHPELRMSVAARVPSDQVDAVVRLAEAVAHTPVDAVHVLGSDDVARVADLAALCSELGLTLTVDVAAWGLRARDVDASDASVTFRFSPERAPAMRWKRAMDVAVGGAALLVAAPLIAGMAVCIRVLDGGPAFFVQTRVGLHGRRFSMLKLRTMVPDAEALKPALADRNEAEGPLFKLTEDPRVTTFGRWLRRTSLDELPQLVHVVTGQMSLVGPRPPLPEEVARYSRAERRRLSMRPGLTGLWQVSGRSALPYTEGVAMDLAYIDRWSFAWDLWILLRTVPAVLSRRGAW